jgi:hypothetical protein
MKRKRESCSKCEEEINAWSVAMKEMKRMKRNKNNAKALQILKIKHTHV